MFVTYHPGTSLLHRLNPIAKLSVVVAYCVVIFLVSSLTLELASLAVILAIAYATGTRQVPAMMVSRFAVTLTLLIVVMQAILVHKGQVLLSLPLYFADLPITDAGLMFGFMTALCFLTVILSSALFVATTDPVALVYALMRLGVPYRYGFMVILMMRFATVFDLEAKTVRDAQKMRGLAIDDAGVTGLLRSIRYSVMPLIVSALSRVDALVISMEGRAFGYGKTRTFAAEDRYTRLDKTLIVLSSATILATMLWAAVCQLSPTPLMPWMPPA